MNLLDFHAGIEHPFFLIAGPCVIESEALAMDSAAYLKKVCEELNINFIYKSSFDKANRTSSDSFRGLGIEKGLRILKREFYSLYEKSTYLNFNTKIKTS